MKILGVIPSRYKSTRLPGKPLLEIKGKSMIQRVYEQALKAKKIDKLIIATDDEKIFNHAQSFNANVIYTFKNHPSGTDRCAEVIERVQDQFDFVVNIQGDEPFIQPEMIDELCAVLNPKIQIATLIKSISDADVLFDISKPKVVKDKHNFALYFSRNPIPYGRNFLQDDWVKHFQYFKHIGIYAYRADVLREISKLPQTNLELAESLEQLRWLENGYKIKVKETQFDSLGIDTEEDWKKANLLS